VLNVDGLLLLIDQAKVFITDVLDTGGILHVLAGGSSHLVSELALELGDHSLSDAEDLEAILEVFKKTLCVLHLPVLLLDESFLLLDILLNLFKKEVDSLALIVLDFFELVEEALDALRRVNLDKVPFTLVEQELKFTLGILTRFNLLRVGQLIRRVLLVKVNEMAHSQITELIHDIPGIILGDCKLVQSHNFRPSRKGVVKVGELTYKVPSFSKIKKEIINKIASWA